MMFQELIQKSSVIDIELSPRTQSCDMPNALALFLALSKLSKQVRLQGQNNVPPSFGWIHLPALGTKTAVLAIREIAPFVSKISYEKSDRDLRFSLGLKEPSPLSLEHIAIERDLPADLTIIVGENSPKDNLETGNPHFKTKNQEQMLEAGLSLLSPFQIPALRLCKKTFSKMEYLPKKKLSLAMLQNDDFRETQAHPRDLRILAKELRELADPEVAQCILFNSQGLLFATHEEIREKVSKFFKTTQKGNWVLFTSPEKEMQKTREKIIFLL